MKYREAALTVTEGLSSISATFSAILNSLQDYAMHGHIKSEELDNIKQILHMTLDTLYADLGAPIYYLHPDLAPYCSSCCECRAQEPSASNDKQ